jgi:hypothetical protein
MMQPVFALAYDVCLAIFTASDAAWSCPTLDTPSYVMMSRAAHRNSCSYEEMVLTRSVQRTTGQQDPCWGLR